ncbi:hypothetical protein GCM10011380_17520 [Sphingomonas metalli]|uniref:Uncharacterized protein n=1 Tax=Sphingomonas metalli TaxID=1779358 RepID=A0A916T4X7_9SPHN|nr:hypothetical protein GCM10011380_17520 [Sphingomonas metalli]
MGPDATTASGLFFRARRLFRRPGQPVSPAPGFDPATLYRRSSAVWGFGRVLPRATAALLATTIRRS